jgi:hypothetical protein
MRATQQLHALHTAVHCKVLQAAFRSQFACTPCAQQQYNRRLALCLNIRWTVPLHKHPNMHSVQALHSMATHLDEQALDDHVALLAHAPCAANGLRLHRCVEAGLQDEDVAGCRQVDAACSAAQQEKNTDLVSM